MSARQAGCPSCGASITFRPGTFVSICSFCSSAVARTDRDIKLLGKVAALVDTGSPLELGAEGIHQGTAFTLVGHTQLRHPAGGIWDEWYLAFDDGRWGWLAEAQGKFYLTFRKEDPGWLPHIDGLDPGVSVDLAAGRFVVTEVSTGTVSAAAGELPWPFEPEESYRFADLSGPRGSFATVDYGSDPPALFVGREVTLADLKVKPRAGWSAKESIKAVALSCPHCGGPLSLRLPDQTQRVVCPSCESLLDASQGHLEYLKAVPGAQQARLFLPPGTEGTFRGTKYTVIGWMRRSCVVESIRYHWDEYLLYQPQVGFRWLTESDGHFSFVSPISAADIHRHDMSVEWQGKTFKKFQEVKATVDSVQGEFYWKVSVGETAVAADYARAPQLISCETSGFSARSGGGAEINWSLSEYVSGEELWKAFGLKGQPPRPHGIAPNQPNRYDGLLRQLAPWTGGFLLALLLLFIAGALTHDAKLLYRQAFSLPFTPDGKAEQVTFSEPFDVPGGQNVRIDVKASVDNSWMFLAGALVSEETGEVSMFQIENAYYHGVEGGESWSEGGPEADVNLSAMPAGKYVLRLEAQWDPAKPPPTFDVSVKAGVLRFVYMLVALGVICIGPGLVLMLRGSLENRRWSESMYAGDT